RAPDRLVIAGEPLLDPGVARPAAALRPLGATIAWITHANERRADGSDWPGFFERFVAAEMRERTLAALAPDAADTQVWPDLHVAPGDLRLRKNRYSALIPGSSELDSVLRGRGITTLLVAGTKTNVCCEATARDAMMMDYGVVMVADCLAALSEEEHRASLETMIQQFADVMTSAEIRERIAGARVE
ncbi:MAG TPA: cysteine hydrolase, partial [Alphaproteobacteria bacterium]|nr:cysteine hydrolase [Alphaproteobacteria bacterium]